MQDYLEKGKQMNINWNKPIEYAYGGNVLNARMVGSYTRAGDGCQMRAVVIEVRDGEETLHSFYEDNGLSDNALGVVRNAPPPEEWVNIYFKHEDDTEIRYGMKYPTEDRALANISTSQGRYIATVKLPENRYDD